MKTMSTEKEIEIITRVFNQYVEYIASSFMCGEIPSSVFAIHTTGTKEKDWLAYVKFKNTIAISVFRCEVWLEDLHRLCKNCKLYLITEPVLEIAALYFMLHPLLQTQNVDFIGNSHDGYEMMLYRAGEMTYQFITDCFQFTHSVQKTVLSIVYHYSQLKVNTPYVNIPTFSEVLKYEQSQYNITMKTLHPHAYRIASKYKSYHSVIDECGLIHLEKKINPKMNYYKKATETIVPEKKMKKKQSREGKVPYSIEIPRTDKISFRDILTKDGNGYYRLTHQVKER